MTGTLNIAGLRITRQVAASIVGGLLAGVLLTTMSLSSTSAPSSAGRNGTVATMAMEAGATTHDAGCAKNDATGVWNISATPLNGATCGILYEEQSGPNAPVLRVTGETGAFAWNEVLRPQPAPSWKKLIYTSPGQLVRCVVSNHMPYIPQSGTFQYQTRCSFQLYSTNYGKMERLTTPTGLRSWSRLKLVPSTSIVRPLLIVAWG